MTYSNNLSVAVVLGLAALAIGFDQAEAEHLGDSPVIVVGAKKFTENAVLAELMAQVLEQHAGARVERRINLAGTQICFNALRGGDIDLYAEYTGTALRSILADPRLGLSRAVTLSTVSEALHQRFRIAVLAPFGFNNTYALIMRREQAHRLGLTQISQLAAHPLRYGVTHELAHRPDGMPGLRRTYRIAEANTVLMEHDLAYQALADGTIDVADGYSTDAKLVGDRLTVLTDDKGFFPPYEAVPLVRQELLSRRPEVAAALALLAGRIDEATMRRLNSEVENDRRSPRQVAAGFLQRLGLASSAKLPEPRAEGLWRLFWQRSSITLALVGEHLMLTGVAVLAACLFAIPLGIAVSRKPRRASITLSVAGVLQTIPSIALLAFMLPLFGIGAKPAIAALFLYGLLPILRNTVTGLRNVDPQILEVGRGLGMTARQLLWRVELPLSISIILAGVRTATVISVGTATLAAFIGAGGLGQPIVTGLSVSDFDLVLCGALPAALLAVLLDGVLTGIERVVTPRGLRLRAAPL